jgi:hypothetical protein
MTTDPRPTSAVPEQLALWPVTVPGITPLSGRPSRPAPLLTQSNRHLKSIGVWTWSLPAWAGRFPDGRTYNTCPSAGICHQVCYARQGTYLWPVVLARHQANLRFVLDDLPGWETAMAAELAAGKFRDRWVRIHDSGDFFSDAYLQAWLRICRARPWVNFYAYTKGGRPLPPAGRTAPTREPAVGVLLRRRPGRRPGPRRRPGRRRLPRRGRDHRSGLVIATRVGPARGPRAAAGRHVGQPHPAFRKLLQGRRFSAWQAEADAADVSLRQHRRRAPGQRPDHG